MDHNNFKVLRPIVMKISCARCLQKATGFVREKIVVVATHGIEGWVNNKHIKCITF